MRACQPTDQMACARCEAHLLGVGPADSAEPIDLELPEGCPPSRWSVEGDLQSTLAARDSPPHRTDPDGDPPRAPSRYESAPLMLAPTEQGAPHDDAIDVRARRPGERKPSDQPASA